MAQFAVLPFQRLHALSHIAWNAGTLAAVDLGLLDPFMQRVR